MPQVTRFEEPKTLGVEPTDRFQRFAAFVRREVGIKLDASKRSMVETRLRRRFTLLHCESLDDYLTYVFENGALDRERPVIVNAVTTNKTDFFREPPHFDHLMAEALPEAIARRRSVSDRVKIWSAASSTGAEAWTAAICCAEYALRHGPFDWGIIGTDVNSEVITQAQTAIFDDTFVAPVQPDLRQRYFRTGQGDFAGQSRIIPELRARVRFFEHNLLSGVALRDCNLDVVFLRNVLIYFGAADQDRAIAQAARSLVRGGILYLGHSEAMSMRHPDFDVLGPSIYRKR